MVKILLFNYVVNSRTVSPRFFFDIDVTFFNNLCCIGTGVYDTIRMNKLKKVNPNKFPILIRLDEQTIKCLSEYSEKFTIKNGTAARLILRESLRKISNDRKNGITL